jgi:hypothetical protein
VPRGIECLGESEMLLGDDATRDALLRVSQVPMQPREANRPISAWCS